MTHSKRYSKSILTSGIWEKSNNNIIKYHPANHKIPVYSNKMKKFDMWTLPWQALWQLPSHIITAQAVVVGSVWRSWWQFSTFQCRIASFCIIWLLGYRDMDRIDIGIKMWYRYWYRYRKICNDMQPYPTHNEVVGGYTGFTPSVRPSRIPCPLCSAYSFGWIHFIFIHLIKQLQKVCRVWSFWQDLKIWIFGNFLKFVTLTLSCFDWGSDVNH